MKTTPLFSVVLLLGTASLSMGQTEAGKALFEKKFNAKIIKTFETDNPTEALLGITSIAVAYSGSDGTGPKYYVASCEKNEQDGFGSLWVYRSADEGLTWTQVQPAAVDIPVQYQNVSWIEGKPTFASEKAWVRMAAYEANKPKIFPQNLSGYWSSSGNTVKTWTGSTWVTATGSNADLVHVPVRIESTPTGTTGSGPMLLQPGEKETSLRSGLVESGTLASETSSGTGNYSCRYAYEYKFEVPRWGWGSGRDPEYSESGTYIYKTLYKIDPATINISAAGDSFEATYYYAGNKRRKFTRDPLPTSEGPTQKPIGASDPHSVFVQPGGMAGYSAPAITPSTETTNELVYSLNDPNLISAYPLIKNNTLIHQDAVSLRDGASNGCLFFYDGSEGNIPSVNGKSNVGLYLFHLGRAFKDGRLSMKLCVRKSTDAGLHWEAPALLSNVPGDYGATAPAIYRGRIWLAFGSTQVISASLTDDLTDSASWIVSEDSGGNYKLPRVAIDQPWLANKPPKDLNFRIKVDSVTKERIYITDPASLDSDFTESCLVAGPDTSAAPGVWLLPKIPEQPFTAKIGITTGWFNSGTNSGKQVLTTEFSGTDGAVNISVLENAFTPNRDIVSLPGAGVKFTAQYVKGTAGQPGKFYALTCPELEPYQCSRLVDRDGNPYAITAEQRAGLSNYENPGATRNTGAIYSSTNLKEWHLEKIFVHSAASELVDAIDYGKIREGFSTFSFAIDGDDMLIVSRTAADIGQWDAAAIDYTAQTFTFAKSRFPKRGLDANIFTFHRVKNFRNLSRDLFLAADKGGNKVFVYEATNGDPAKVGQFNLPGEPTVSGPSGIVQTPGASGDVFIANSEPGGSIKRYSRAGAYLSTLCNFTGEGAPTALATGTSSLLYATVASGSSTKLYKVTTPATGSGVPTYIATTASNGAPVNLAARNNGLALASTGFLYSATPGGFARISSTGGSVAISAADPVLALCRAGQNLCVVQSTGTSIPPELDFSTLSNVTLTALNLDSFSAPIAGMVHSGTSLFWTGTSSPAGWEAYSTPLIVP